MDKKDNIILIGFMGCGKSSVGVRLSQHLDMPFLDTDSCIEEKAGKKIPDIFAQEGEQSFRNMETEILQELLADTTGKIISTGGGLPVKIENRELLKKLGTVFYLQLAPETVYQRVGQDENRPLLQCENPLEKIRILMAERRDAYEGTADSTVVVDGKSYEEIIKEIKTLYEEGMK